MLKIKDFKDSKGKDWVFYDPNLFNDGIENFLITPMFPLDPNILNKTFSVINQYQPNGKIFSKVNYDTLHSLMCYSIVDNKVNVLDALLNTKYISINSAVYNQNLHYIGKPLDIAVNSITEIKDVDMAIQVMLKGGRSDNENNLIKVLEYKAQISKSEPLKFKCLLAANLLKTINNQHSCEYINNFITFNKMKNQNIDKQVGDHLINKIINSFDKLEKSDQDEIIKVVSNFSQKEFDYIGLELKRYKTNLDLSSSTEDESYSLLTEILNEDETLKFYPIRTINLNDNVIKENNWEELEKNIKKNMAVENQNVFSLNEHLTFFLFYQTLQDLNALNKYLKQKDINEKISFDDFTSIEVITKEQKNNISNNSILSESVFDKINRIIEKIRGNNIYLYNKKLPERIGEFTCVSEEVKKEFIEKRNENQEKNTLNEKIEEKTIEVKEDRKKKSFLGKIFGK